MCSAKNRGKQGKKMENSTKFCDHNKKKTQKITQKSSKDYRLSSFNELPDYMKDNEYILKYYRAEWPLKQAFFSLFKWHNETLNVWTHLLGFALFVVLTVVNVAHVSQAVDLFGIFRAFPSDSDKNSSNGTIQPFMSLTNMVNLNNIQGGNQIHHMVTEAARWPFYVYLSGSMFCLLSSSICHLFCCHSHDMNLWLLRMDYTGITVMIITSFFPPIYYIFQCQPLWQIIYLAGISIFGAFTIATLLSPTLSSGKCRNFRAILFVSMGLFGLVPAIHACVINWSNPRRNLTLAYESAMALSYLIGTGFYVSRVPERWRPGWFDLAGHSHQIFHVFVLLGALSHYGAALIFMEFRDTVGC